MNLRDVLFVGGDPKKFASVRIRCLDIARQLGCGFKFVLRRADEIPNGFGAYILVKPNLELSEYTKLRGKGAVVWDIVDDLPPFSDFAAYLVSTNAAKACFSDLGRVVVIPHQHCNYENEPHLPVHRRPGWIGNRHWQPTLPNLDFTAYHTDGKTRLDVVRAHTEIGIGLNLRQARPGGGYHIRLNSGLKLINCIGFGLPSVSANEPAYREFGEGCTIFTDEGGCANAVRLLQTDYGLYERLRAGCQAKAAQFHIENIADQYRTLIASL